MSLFASKGKEEAANVYKTLVTQNISIILFGSDVKSSESLHCINCLFFTFAAQNFFLSVPVTELSFSKKLPDKQSNKQKQSGFKITAFNFTTKRLKINLNEKKLNRLLKNNHEEIWMKCYLQKSKFFNVLCRSGESVW